MRKLSMLLLIVSGFILFAAGIVFTIMSFIEKQSGIGVALIAITFFVTVLYFMFVAIVGSSISRNRKMELGRIIIIVGVFMCILSAVIVSIAFGNGIYSLHQVILENHVDATPSTLYVQETVSSNGHFIWAFFGLTIIVPSVLTVVSGPMVMGITEY